MKVQIQVAVQLSVVLLATALAAPVAAGGGDGVSFQSLAVEEGLSQVSVHAIAQDRVGFLWLATQDGLNRFDGYEFIVFRNDPADATGLSDSWVRCLLVDSSGRLWAGTHSGGLNSYDATTGVFEALVNDSADPGSLADNRIEAIAEDRRGRLWIATHGAGLDRYDREQGRFIHHRAAGGGKGRLASDELTSLLVTGDDSLWVGSAGGLDRIDPASSEHLASYRWDAKGAGWLPDVGVTALGRAADGAVWIGGETGLSRLDVAVGRVERVVATEAPVSAVLEDRGGGVWVGLYGGGLLYRAPGGSNFAALRHDPTDPNSLGDDTVLTLFEDRDGTVWVGTYQGGASSHNRQRVRFPHVNHDPFDPGSLSVSRVRCFIEDRDRRLWVGTDGGGLDCLDAGGKGFRHHRHDAGDPASLAHDFVRDLAVDGSGRLWVATNGGGLDRRDSASGGFVHFAGDLGSDRVYGLTVDRAGALWVATEGGGLSRIDSATLEPTRFRHRPDDPASLSSDNLYVVREDSYGMIWVGSRGAGLNRLDPATGEVVRYQHDPDDPGSLGNNVVISIHEDRSRRLWVGTWGGGLHRLQRDSGSFVRYTTRDGCPSGAISGILEDDQGRLWISTIRGLARFDPDSGSFRAYGVADGLQSLGFNGNAYYRSPSGEMYFGGINGYNVFDPESIADRGGSVPMVITEFRLFEKPLPVPVTTAERPLRLSYRENFLSFGFAALDFVSPERLEYAYRLDGVDKDWVRSGRHRFARYPDLAPGSYTFHVRGSRGAADPAASEALLRFRIDPPFWMTAWFRVLLAIALLASAVGWYRWRVRRFRQLQRQLEETVHQRTEELRQVNQELERVSLTDPLTGLRNRRFIQNTIELDLAQIRRIRHQRRRHSDAAEKPLDRLVFMILDIDHFKSVNDRWGHEAGDRVLVEFAQVLHEVCRAHDVITRWGGEEFLIVARFADGDPMPVLAERLRARVADFPFAIAPQQSIRCTCSIGFAVYPFVADDPDALSWEQVVAVADSALYMAKNEGRNRWVGILSTSQLELGPRLVGRIRHHLDDLLRSGEIEVLRGKPE